jgi:hypothetical protein
MEADELKKILGQAESLMKKHKLSRAEALLLVVAHEVTCIHFHVDQVLRREAKQGEG